MHKKINNEKKTINCKSQDNCKISGLGLSTAIIKNLTSLFLLITIIIFSNSCVFAKRKILQKHKTTNYKSSKKKNKRLTEEERKAMKEADMWLPDDA